MAAAILQYVTTEQANQPVHDKSVIIPPSHACTDIYLKETVPEVIKKAEEPTSHLWIPFKRIQASLEEGEHHTPGRPIFISKLN